MPLKIAQLGQPCLRQFAATVSRDEIKTSSFQQLIDEMVAIVETEKAAGLAAPQVFQSKRFFVAAVLPALDPEAPPGVEVFVNPRIVAASDEMALGWEGCLSFPELLVRVPRRLGVQVEYSNRQGESRTIDLFNMAARIVQHECDHLDGILTIDRAASTKDIIKASEISAVDTKDHEKKP